jgi:hydroxyacylglutathione hydrolase
MKIHTLVVGAFEVNCYVVADEARRALVIDPGADADKVAAVIRRHDLSVAAYVCTHGHIDHVSGLAEVHRLFPAPIGMHPRDAKWAFTQANQMLPFYPAPDQPPVIERALADGQQWQDGDLKYQVLETPGHTPGGVCLYFPDEGVVFTGDTLFANSVGRTDLPGGNDRVLSQSLAKLTALPDATRVCAGHGPETTIGQEKSANPFL